MKPIRFLPPRRWRSALQRFGRSESAATAIEYSLIASFIAIVIVASVAAVGGRLAALFTTTAAAF